MKALLMCGLVLSLSAFGNTRAQSPGSGSQGSGYAPNDGSANPGNPGTYTTPKAGLGKAAPTTTGHGTDINGPGTMGTGSPTPSSGMSPSRTNNVTGSDMGTTMQSGNADPNTEANENLERSNTTPTPIPDDTTLQGNTQTGPYKTGKNKQSQEATDEDLDYRAIPGNDHSDENASGNQ
jgi:hypothetical protein